MHYPRGSGEEHLPLVLSLRCRNEHLELQMTCMYIYIKKSLFLSINLSNKKCFYYFYRHSICESSALCRYEAGLLFAYVAFIPFCEAGSIDSLSLRVSLTAS